MSFAGRVALHARSAPQRLRRWLRTQITELSPNAHRFSGAVPDHATLDALDMIGAPSGPRIFAYLGERAVGDFVLGNCAASSLKRSLVNATLTVYYRDDRPYKREVIEMNPHIDRVVCCGPSGPPLLLDYFDVAWQAPFEHPSAQWNELRVGKADFFLTPSMVNFHQMGGFPVRARLAIPEAREQQLRERLRALGVPPDRWFACIHAKGPGYRFRPNTGGSARIDPAPYFELCKHIIEKQGGVAVRLGDPSMAPYPDTPGLIDLSRLTDEFLVHAFAVSRCRYLVAADSGIFTVGSAFGVPTGLTNAASPSMPWNEHDIVVTKEIISPDGMHYRQAEARKAGLLREDVHELGYRVVDNSVADLCRVADQLHEETADCTGWRRPAPELTSAGAPVSAVPWPIAGQVRASGF
jgi:putative glycosyltransferase (TIGR04372 family)